MSDFISYASWHEAGHIAVAIRHRLDFGALRSEHGRPTIFPFDITQERESVGDFLLGGVAAESLHFFQIDWLGAAADARLYSSRFGRGFEQKSIATLPHYINARRILAQSKDNLKSLRDAIEHAILESSFESGDSFVLLSHEEIYQIWNAGKSSK